jgi:hypothetical protein
MRQTLLFRLILPTLLATPTIHAAAARANYDLVVDVRPDSHSISVSGTWTIPAAEVQKDPDQGRTRTISFLSSEKLLKFRMVYEGMTVPVECHPDEGQLTCKVHIAMTEFRMDVPVNLGFAAAPFHVYGRGMCTICLLQEYINAEQITEGCERTAVALTRIWGPFPGGDVKIVEVNFKGVLLGVGESSYILADTSQIRRDFEMNYWAHELSHQWWGNSVHATYPSPGASLLTEGMAEYGALSVNRELNGKQGEADYLSDRLAHEPSGAPMAHYLTILARHEDLPLTAVTDSDGGAIALRCHIEGRDGDRYASQRSVRNFFASFAQNSSRPMPTAA